MILYIYFIIEYIELYIYTHIIIILILIIKYCIIV